MADLFCKSAPLGLDIQNTLRQSYDYRPTYDNAKVAIDLGRTSNLRNILWRTHGFSLVRFSRKIWDSVCKLAYEIPKRNTSTPSVTIVSRSYDELKITLWQNRKIFCKSGPVVDPFLGIALKRVISLDFSFVIFYLCDRMRTQWLFYNTF